jgi:hypothetical protein
MEWSEPSETGEEPNGVFSIRGARNVGAQATRDSLAPRFGKRKNLYDGDKPGLTGNLSGSCWGQTPLRKEKW